MKPTKKLKSNYKTNLSENRVKPCDGKHISFGRGTRFKLNRPPGAPQYSYYGTELPASESPTFGGVVPCHSATLPPAAGHFDSVPLPARARVSSAPQHEVPSLKLQPPHESRHIQVPVRTLALL